MIAASSDTSRYRARLAYDGSAYAGWQVQPDQPTVQQGIEQALHTLTREHVRVHSSGRTDAGVHARGQVIHFDLTAPWRPRRLLYAMNALLDDDVRILRLDAVPADFHARFSAREKEYRYFIYNGPVLPPFIRAYRLHVRHPLDIPAMQAAAARLEGRHDFAAFTANPKRSIETTVRDLYELSVGKNGAEIVIRACADGFLYKMVRGLAGFLIKVGQRRIAPEITDDILASRIRTARVRTAPPQGLFLWKVTY